MRYEGFNTLIYSPAPKFLSGTEIGLIFEQQQEELRARVRRELLPLRVIDA